MDDEAAEGETLPAQISVTSETVNHTIQQSEIQGREAPAQAESQATASPADGSREASSATGPSGPDPSGSGPYSVPAPLVLQVQPIPNEPPPPYEALTPLPPYRYRPREGGYPEVVVPQYPYGQNAAQYPSNRGGSQGPNRRGPNRPEPFIMTEGARCPKCRVIS